MTTTKSRLIHYGRGPHTYATYNYNTTEQEQEYKSAMRWGDESLGV